MEYSSRETIALKILSANKCLPHTILIPKNRHYSSNKSLMTSILSATSSFIQQEIQKDFSAFNNQYTREMFRLLRDNSLQKPYSPQLNTQNTIDKCRQNQTTKQKRTERSRLSIDSQQGNKKTITSKPKQLFLVESADSSTTGFQRKATELQQIEIAHKLICSVNKQEVEPKHLSATFEAIQTKFQHLKRKEEKLKVDSVGRMRELECAYNQLQRNKRRITKAYLIDKTKPRTPAPSTNQEQTIGTIPQMDDQNGQQSSFGSLEGYLNHRNTLVSQSSRRSNSNSNSNYVSKVNSNRSTLKPNNKNLPNERRTHNDLLQENTGQNDQSRRRQRNNVGRKSRVESHKKSSFRNTSLIRRDTKNLISEVDIESYNKLNSTKGATTTSTKKGSKIMTTNTRSPRTSIRPVAGGRSPNSPKQIPTSKSGKYNKKSVVQNELMRDGSVNPHLSQQPKLPPESSAAEKPTSLSGEMHFNPQKRGSRRSSIFKFKDFEFLQSLSKDFSKEPERIALISSCDSSSSSSKASPDQSRIKLTSIFEAPRPYIKINPKRRNTKNSVNMPNINEQQFQQLHRQIALGTALNKRRGFVQRVSKAKEAITTPPPPRPAVEFNHLNINYEKSFIINRQIVQTQANRLRNYLQSIKLSVETPQAPPSPAVRPKRPRDTVSENMVSDLANELGRFSNKDMGNVFFEFDDQRYLQPRRDRISYYGMADCMHKEVFLKESYCMLEEELECTVKGEELLQTAYGELAPVETGYVVSLKGK